MSIAHHLAAVESAALTGRNSIPPPRRTPMPITPDQIPAQSQDRTPALESEMVPRPMYDDLNYKGSGKLQDKVAG